MRLPIQTHESFAKFDVFTGVKFRLWRRAVLWHDINVSDVHVASIFSNVTCESIRQITTITISFSHNCLPIQSLLEKAVQ
jgi:hypothetical protein